uniref:DDT domain-containing protein n=1 Tax=Anthurium amnicola TaxID=1678845 RepID=A0A1D1ZDW6_9ARAE
MPETAMAGEGPATATANHDGSSSEEQWQPNHSSERKLRFPRACTSRPATAHRLYQAAAAAERKKLSGATTPAAARREREEQLQRSKIITPLVEPPPPGQLPRWSIRSMWEFASLLNFLHVFRPLLNISVEFSAEELETALITPNSTLDDIHIPLLKAIPPITRMALGRATWVTVLCRKLKDWWHWVADGEIPIVASHGVEVETYKTLEPATRVLILKALCDIRVEQEDVRSYIDESIKHGVQLSAFRRERVGGDSHGVSFWYEDDPIIGHRLYREIRRVEVVKKAKSKGAHTLPIISCQWETVATNLDEFQDVSEKLFSSKNRTETALGKKLKIDFLPEIEKIHKRKERLLKKQHREALLLDSFLTADGLSSGRSLRDRKPVTYTFDDFDRSINEAIKITKKRQASPEQHVVRRENAIKPEPCTNGRWNGPSQPPHNESYESFSPKSKDYEDTDGEHRSEILDRRNRRRKRPQRYSEKDFVEAISDNEADFDSDDIMGEAIYDDEYLRSRKQKRVSSSSEEDEEYRWEEENFEEYEEEEPDDSSSASDDSDGPQRYKRTPSRSRRTKLRSVDELQAGLRRSKRSTRPRIDYRQYELSDSDADSKKPEKSNASDAHSDASNDLDLSMSSGDSQFNGDDSKEHAPDQGCVELEEKEENKSTVKMSSPEQEGDGAQRRPRYLDLNEVAPSSGFDDGPGFVLKGENKDDF